MRNLEKNGRTGAPPALHRFHHIIWMGDLNYRLDLARGLPRAANWEHEVKWKHINNIVQAARYDELAVFDELRGERELGNAFASFSEGPLKFPPTFKVVRGLPTSSYQILRLPSYCDRIMWHSLPRHARHITLVEYSSMEQYCTSDHKPVYAVFELAIPKRIRRFGSVVPTSAVKCTVDVLLLRVHVIETGRRPVGNGGASGNAHDGNGSGDDSAAVATTAAAGGAGVSALSSAGGGAAAAPNNGMACESPDDGATGPLMMKEESSGIILGSTGVGGRAESPGNNSTTRRPLRIEYYGTGLFLRDRPVKTEVLLHAAGEVDPEELPTIPLTPVESIGDLMFRYMTIVVGGSGSRAASSCVLPIAELVERRGFHRVRTELELAQYGRRVGTVELEAELCMSMECWIDSRNRIVQTRKWR
jgi:hypothetical protein